jgi:hypothetical protein
MMVNFLLVIMLWLYDIFEGFMLELHSICMDEYSVDFSYFIVLHALYVVLLLCPGQLGVLKFLYFIVLVEVELPPCVL